MLYTCFLVLHLCCLMLHSCFVMLYACCDMLLLMKFSRLGVSSNEDSIPLVFPLKKYYFLSFIYEIISEWVRFHLANCWMEKLPSKPNIQNGWKNLFSKKEKCLIFVIFEHIRTCYPHLPLVGALHLLENQKSSLLTLKQNMISQGFQ